MIASRLLLVDGTQLLYRSFFGIRGLTTRAGEPSNAVFGFVRGIHQLIECWKPSHLAVAWDGGAPAARLNLLPEYKAQRPPMPDDLRSQIQPVHDFLHAAAIPLVRLDHEEADDVLASLARQSAPEAGEVMIITSDKDMLQLIGGNIVMAAWAKEDVPMGREGVFAKTGVYPEQIVDWLALTGDAADNIPGVEGLGPKTAAKLLAQFGTLTALWEKLADVKSERVRANLAAARERVERNRLLVTLRDDLACRPDWDTLATRPEVASAMRPFYSRMDFHTLIKECDQGELF